ncbi:CDP-glycerol glycerophosphotransferase family protein [Alteromonas halophila]|uniref:CDP-glycerol--glycerophosphate glycerophosphotransferase n=1 Tax=Alteromonas halophila TaxID=516698 RepID=A0A918JT16_9ALTE|nr:CDP-glycerol glycerophosphotransferase family protein [Alteromonas halophila]GGW96149.1 CDP-glycerol--glycerophosphate glycerophosphotransferase [Alteromonas halophila]
MSKRYLLFASLPYAFSILRPLQEEIRKRGGDVAWFLESGCADLLQPDERRLRSFDEVKQFNPLAVFTPGNMIYDFFPGVKVSVFHGYPIAKRGEKSSKTDDHFAIRGWFDMYCTQGSSSTTHFKRLEQEHGHFKVYETGWCKVDPFFTDNSESVSSDNPTVLYATTFSKGISSAPVIYDTIEKLVKTKPWNWVLTFHPKINDASLLSRYRALADKYEHVHFEDNVRMENFRQADVMLSDSSSIILEFMLLDKPVVTYRNTNPGPHLLNVTALTDIEAGIEKGLSRPDSLMNNIRQFTAKHEAYRDGHNSARVLDAVDDFVTYYQGKLKSRPVNLIRKLKLRKRLKYWALN